MESKTLHGLVATAASVHSEEPAVTFDDGSGSSESLSYKHLHCLSSELCAVLRHSCQPNKGVVGLYCRENVLLPVWIIGIMQTPAAYVPLDPSDPGLLSARVIQRCGLMFCAVQTELMEKFQECLCEYLKLEVCVVLPKFKITLVQVKSHQDREQYEQTEQAVPQTAASNNSFAYVLHTSGTTGLPKIVKVPHSCIYPNIETLSMLFQIEKGDVVFLASPLTFDPSVVEIFMALSSGAKLLIVPALLKKMPRRLAQLLFMSHKTTVLQATPTLFCRFGSAILKKDVLSPGSSLRVLVLGGEPCPTPEQLANWKHVNNKTSIFNIYGITEVSCWALCYRVNEREIEARQTTPVPIGCTLSGTEVEVRDELGAVIKEGVGQVFIGGEHRVCLLDDEDTIVPGTMRATGDWVRITNKKMFFLGRRDRMIKRHGHRVNLDTVQQLISAAPLVESCAVGLHENHWLMAFIVMSKSEDGKAAPVVVCDAQMRDEQDGAAGQVGRDVMKQLSRVLAYYCLPDTVVIVPEIPQTSHGKVDMKALMKIYQMNKHGLQGTSQRDFTTGGLESLWKASLGLPKDTHINDDSNFLVCGGDSLKALVFYEGIRSATGLTSPSLLEIILDGTFSDIMQHVHGGKSTPTLKNDAQSKPKAKKRHLETLPEVISTPKRKLSEKEAFKVIKRGSQVDGRHEHNSEGFFLTVGDGDDGLQALSMLWSSDTGRCVDASPVILVEQMDKSTVFIGSHSHRIQALDLDSGRLVWERVLGDRIEASAAVSKCGTLVIVGCYDGCLYFLDVSSGETEWVFKTGDAVKCCPAVDAKTGLILAGSHDGTVYALDPMAQQCVWKRHCGGGAVFSSPFIHPSLRHLYVATLGGRLLCLNVDGGEVLWSYFKDAPFFSSPVGSDTHILIGSADGNICCFSVTGELIWQFLTQASVFSSPCLTPDQQQVLCGSHDGLIYCLNLSDGSLLWSFETSGRVYSSPCVFPSALGTGYTLVGLASTDGTVWILDGKTGLKLASHTLPGELFSSPVVYRDLIVIGCRNDFVYCLKLDSNILH